MKNSYLLASLTTVVSIFSSGANAKGKFYPDTKGCELTNSKNINVIKEGKADFIKGEGETETGQTENNNNNESMEACAQIITENEDICNKLGEAVEDRKNFDREKSKENQFSDEFTEKFGEYKDKLDSTLFG